MPLEIKLRGIVGFYICLFGLLIKIKKNKSADSTLAIISVAKTLTGITAKFRPFFSKVTSASLRVLDDKLITQFVLSTKNVGETDGYFS